MASLDSGKTRRDTETQERAPWETHEWRVADEPPHQVTAEEREQAAERFRKWLAAELRGRGMTQQELARRAGVNQATISHVLTGKKAPGLNLAMRVARALDVSMDPMFAEQAFEAKGGTKWGSITPTSPTGRRLLAVYTELSEEDRLDVLAYARMRAKLAVRRGRRGN